MRKDKEQMKEARRKHRLSANERVDEVLFEWVWFFWEGISALEAIWKGVEPARMVC